MWIRSTMEEVRDPYRNSPREKAFAVAAILVLVAIGVLQGISLGFLSHERPPPADWDGPPHYWWASVAMDRVEHRGHLAGTGLSILCVALLLRFRRDLRSGLLIAAVPAFLSQVVWVLWALSGFLVYGWEPSGSRWNLELDSALFGMLLPWVAMVVTLRRRKRSRFETRWAVIYPLLVFGWTIVFIRSVLMAGLAV